MALQPEDPQLNQSSTAVLPRDVNAWEAALGSGADCNIIWTEEELIQEGVEIKYRWFEINTPIHLTLWLEDYDSAELLLHQGAKINIHNAIGRTPLTEAVQNQKVKTVAFLIAHGANLDAPTINCTLDKSYIYFSRPPEAGITPLLEALRFADVQTVHMLVEGGVDVNHASDQGWTPLDIALLDKQGPMMDILLGHGGRFSKAPISQIPFRSEFRKMAHDLLSASTGQDLLPSRDLQEVYWWVLSRPDIQAILHALVSGVSTMSHRLISVFFEKLCEVSELEDLQTIDKPFCSQCLAFQAWASPTYSDQSEGYKDFTYGDKAIYSLYPSRDRLQSSAQAGCELCRMIADGHDKYERYRGSWIKDDAEKREFDLEMAGSIRLEVERPAASFLFLRVLVGSSFNFILRLTHLDQETIVNTCHYNDQTSRTDSPEAFRLAQHWLVKCESSHAECQKFSDKEALLPTRVVDVGSDERDPFLVKTHGQKGRFCALSYCWGQATSPAGFYQTTKANLSSHYKAMPFNDLPSTLRDAILVARRLGFQYIWIDALCIIQDDSRDWGHETAKMQHIYAGASLTISTLDSKSSEDGLFRPRQSRNITAMCLNYRVPKAFRQYAAQSGASGRPLPRVTPMYLAVCPSDLAAMEPSLYGTVHERAWTLQEQMMSTRILYYGKGILWWECFELRASETYPGPLLVSDASSWERSETKRAIRGIATGRHGHVFNSWQDLLSDYTRRELTDKRDRLTAILGLGKSMEPFINSEFVAGVWSGDLMVKSLCWETGGHDQTTRDSRFPSWSWASVAGTAAYDFAGYREVYGVMRPVASVVSFETTPVDEAQTAIAGSITLRGTLGRLKPSPRRERSGESYYPYRQDCAADPIDECWYVDALESDSTARRVRLLLQVVAGEPERFRRIGIGLGTDEGCSEVKENAIVVIV